jgi:hypothetical protein
MPTVINSHGKIELTAADKKFIRKNFSKMTNTQLADALGLKLQFMRTQLKIMDLLRMELEYWSEEQILFLKQNYREIGDKELAELFNLLWKKKKTWTLKHIEKKRKYLKLKRTRKQINAIRERNVANGCFKGTTTWLTRKPAKLGEVRVWKNANGFLFEVIKTKNGFTDYGRWLWEKHNGPIPEGMTVATKTGGSRINLTIKKLILIPREKAASLLHSILSDNYVAGLERNPELRKLIKLNPQMLNIKRQQIILNRTLK